MNAEKITLHQLIEAVLSHIPFDGWSTASLKMAAADCGVSEAELTVLFPAGVADAITAYGAYADEMMVGAFEERYQDDSLSMPVHIKIRTLILIRLEQAAPHKEVVRRTLAALAHPQHAKLGAKMLYDTVDAMWRACAV